MGIYHRIILCVVCLKKTWQTASWQYERSKAILILPCFWQPQHDTKIHIVIIKGSGGHKHQRRWWAGCLHRESGQRWWLRGSKRDSPLPHLTTIPRGLWGGRLHSCLSCMCFGRERDSDSLNLPPWIYKCLKRFILLFVCVRMPVYS